LAAAVFLAVMLFLGDQIGTRAAYSTAENPAGQRVNFF
jgi:hypothetical protein